MIAQRPLDLTSKRSRALDQCESLKLAVGKEGLLPLFLSWSFTMMWSFIQPRGQALLPDRELERLVTASTQPVRVISLRDSRRRTSFLLHSFCVWYIIGIAFEPIGDL